MSNFVWVILGGALGAPARYLTDRVISSQHSRDWPWGTFSVNVLGSSLLAAVMSIAWETADPGLLLFLTAGFLGAFTTWSAFAVEVVQLVGRGQLVNAVSYVVGTFAAAGCAVAVVHAAFG